MSGFDKCLRTLELNKVLEMLASQAVLSDTKSLALSIEPSSDFEVVKHLNCLTSDAYSLLLKFGAPKFYGASNSASALARAAVGGVMSPLELLKVADTLRTIRIVKEWRQYTADIDTSVDKYFSLLFPNKFLEDRIYFCIKGEEEISDNASDLLADIRRKIRSESSAVRSKLESVVRSRAKYLQEAIITQRDGRFVVPVKAEHRSMVQGLVHDSSASGATLFIEPMSVVESNNELKILASRENEEIARILAELSALVSEYGDSINNSYKALCELDLLFAKANLAVKQRAMSPKLNTNGYTYLKNARHPLIPQKTVVPITVDFGKTYNTLVITGPNTGGKTVTLKTIGLFSLMAMCGLMVPADDSTEVPVYNNIFVDLGDEQNIEQSLSTFSSHMVNIISIVENADSGSLVLIDELGAGTDPIEGAALAKAILIKLSENGANIVATTHYAELKTYALETEGVQNASCEFDIQTLKPTYRLIIGTPGRSNAFAISKRLGLSDEIVNSAKNFVSEQDRHFEKVLESLEKSRQEIEEKEREVNSLRVELKTANKKVADKLSDVEQRAKAIIDKARRDASVILDSTRADSARLINELETLKKAALKGSAADMLQKARAAAKSALNEMTKTADPVVNKSNVGYVLPRPLKVGDRVLLVDIDKQGDVIELSKDGSKAYVSAGIVKLWADISNIRLAKVKEQTIIKGRRVSGLASKTERDTKGEIDLRGMAADEALIELDKYIDEALLSGFGSVVIIHGKGTGVLKNAVAQYLKTCKAVRAFRLGTYGEGEHGVTIAELK